MLYYIYIGSNRIIIDHLSKVTGGMFVAVSSSQKAAKVIDGIRERYNISILYEQTDVREADCIEITYLRKRYPRVYITLITEALKSENRKAYLQDIEGIPPPYVAAHIRYTLCEYCCYHSFSYFNWYSHCYSFGKQRKSYL